MTQEEIISGSKLIAEYLGWQYIPFNDLQGFSKPGWWKVSKKVWGDDDLGKYMASKVKNHKDKMGRNYYVCRKHSELRFWNSLDALVPVIQKIEKEGGISCYLHDNGCTGGYGLTLEHLVYKTSSFDLSNWSNNVFKVIVKYLENNGETF